MYCELSASDKTSRESWRDDGRTDDSSRVSGDNHSSGSGTVPGGRDYYITADDYRRPLPVCGVSCDTEPRVDRHRSQDRMAPTYKLYYFNLKGLGETLRLILTYMEADWEDVRIERDGEEWAVLKPTMPFGKLPLLEEDGKRIPQTVATTRYLATKAGLSGKDAWENLQIDIIADTLRDIWQPMYAVWLEKDEEKKKALKETFVKETLPFFFKKLDETVKANGGYLANKKLSWVDFQFTTFVDILNFVIGSGDAAADYPHLHQLRQTVLSLPRVQQWVAKRPKTDR